MDQMIPVQLTPDNTSFAADGAAREFPALTTLDDTTGKWSVLPAHEHSTLWVKANCGGASRLTLAIEMSMNGIDWYGVQIVDLVAGASLVNLTDAIGPLTTTVQAVAAKIPVPANYIRLVATPSTTGSATISLSASLLLF